MSVLETTRLGRSGPLVSRLGMGCWAIGGHGWGPVRDEDSLRAVRCALEGGVRFFDTADTYGLGKSEELLAEALGSSRHDVVVASKGGVRWDDSGRVWRDSSPAHLRRAVEDSLRRLKLERIPLYYLHKPDGATPVAESVAALERLREEGKIGAVGVANVSAAQLREALGAAPVAAVQVHLNLFSRRDAEELARICRAEGVGLVAWGALADGLLTGKFGPGARLAEDDHRRRMPEFSGRRYLEHLDCVAALERLSAAKGRRLSQLALRWVLDWSEFACPLFGAKTEAQVRENLGASGWTLSKEDLAAVDAAAAPCLN